jgi:peptidoglycan/xylan/chitin deacetylase (PgdA/CDA1 family)
VTDALTLPPEQLEEQWNYLKWAGYHALSLSDFRAIVAGTMECPPNSLLITFDDGYKNNLTYVYPLLQKLGWCATVFIIAGTLDGTFSSKEHVPMHELMDINDLRQIDHRVIQLAMHGYHHENFAHYPSAEIHAILKRSIDLFKANKLAVDNVVAYPYGRVPLTQSQLDKFKQCFTGLDISLAFKTGYGICTLPVKDKYMLPRIDIAGTDSIDEVLSKITYGIL